MAASRLGSSARRTFKRYKLFFFVAFMLVTVQLYLGYSFYSIKEEETRRLENDWAKRKMTAKTKSKFHSWHDGHPRIASEGRNQSTKGLNELQQVNTSWRNDTMYGAGHSLINADRSLHASHVNNSSHHFILQQPLQNLIENADGVKSRPESERYSDRAKHHLQLPKLFTAKCQITETNDKEAYSAIHRADTEMCKQQIADTVCLQKEGKLFPQEVKHTTCPLRTDKKGQYIGCYRDDQKKRILGNLMKSYPTDNSISKCINVCLSSGFEHAGVQWGLECWCAERFNAENALSLPEEECSTPCPGDSTKACGGYNAMNIYLTGAGVRTYFSPPLVEVSELSADVVPVRIVFILTLNGRALRQVKRLIKALYHRDHYFLIHVDARQEFLYRELANCTAPYDNIRMAPDRFATIWGGANLSTMLLKAMDYLFTALPHWKWDFLINLSESDYPVRTVQQLVAFLSSYKDKNFLKSHGKDTPRFIQKQGLERTFVQCDNHMWRVGRRQLPLGIRIDGGSDWVALNRDYCHYLTTSDNEMLAALKQYWQYTLLPGESFWHTALQNSEFCTTFANNNLHVVNWNRRKGCKCQYKAIVDWCGCSPNDFLAGDMDKFMAMHAKKKIVFFARKFEAIVSQEIINQLDAFLYGSYPAGTPALSSYWENIYMSEDRLIKAPDSHLTFYDTFARGAVMWMNKSMSKMAESSECRLSLEGSGAVTEAHVYQQADHFQGVLVKFKAHKASSDQRYMLEVYVKYQPMFTLHSVSGPVTRLKNMQIGTNFDPKEEFFRNIGNLLGPHSSLILALWWGVGAAFRVTAAIIDPAQQVALWLDIQVAEEEAAEHVVTFDLALETPLRPGIWTVKLLYAWNIVAVLHFLITPYTYYGGRPITDEEAQILHSGPRGGSYQSDIVTTTQNNKDLVATLELDNPVYAQDIAKKNARRTGASLTAWIMELTYKFWHVEDVCIVAPNTICSDISVCLDTIWSSMSPDPKSHLGAINDTTGCLR